MTWVELAACRGMPFDLFNPGPGQQQIIAQAKTVCAECKVMTQNADSVHRFRSKMGVLACDRCGGWWDEPQHLPCEYCGCLGFHSEVCEGFTVNDPAHNDSSGAQS